MIRALTTTEVAEALRMTPRWVAQQCYCGKIRAKKFGTQWRITEEELKAFMGVSEPVERVNRKELERDRQLGLAQLGLPPLSSAAPPAPERKPEPSGG